MIPKLAECSKPGCSEAASNLRHGVRGFRETVLSEIESRIWPTQYEELDSQQMDVLDKTIVVTAKAADSISERIRRGDFPETLHEERTISSEITAIRDDLVALASALVAKYRHEALTWKVTQSGLSRDTLEALGIQ